MIDQNEQMDVYKNFKGISVILVIFYSIITLGIYIPYWFFRRCDQINKLYSQEKLDKSVFTFLIIAYSVCIPINLCPEVLISEYTWLATIFPLLYILQITAYITMLVQLFKTKRIFQSHFYYHNINGRFTEFSGLAIFFFSVYYLQYKINRFK